jgi:hypothetical protein
MLCGEKENHCGIAYPELSPLPANPKSIKYSSFFVFCMYDVHSGFGMKDPLFFEFQHMSAMPHLRLLHEVFCSKDSG